MSFKQIFSLFLIVILFTVGNFLIGCSGTDGATESDAGSIEASPAKNNPDEADKKDDKGKKKGKDNDENKEEAVPVEVSELILGSIESVLTFSANLEAERQVSVVAEAQRQVTELLVEEGDRVRRGQILLRLQDDEQHSVLKKVKSQVTKAKREFVRQ
ncbi:MAG: biotin/lipoyl-binding protein, partial [Acidobacteria bacterium]|nr:biotin/lipoyl-binding protein [Acidobacteriota bacterium]